MKSFRLEKYSKKDKEGFSLFFKSLGLGIICLVAFILLGTLIASLTVRGVIVILLFVIAINSFVHREPQS